MRMYLRISLTISLLLYLLIETSKYGSEFLLSNSLPLDEIELRPGELFCVLLIPVSNLFVISPVPIFGLFWAVLVDPTMPLVNFLGNVLQSRLSRLAKEFELLQEEWCIPTGPRASWWLWKPSTALKFWKCFWKLWLILAALCLDKHAAADDDTEEDVVELLLEQILLIMLVSIASLLL